MRSIVITGVSRGLGAALFDELYRRGDRVLALGRRFSEPQHELAAAEPGRVVLRYTDLADPASLPGAAELAAFLPSTGACALVHNAAVVTPIGALGAVPDAQLAAAVAVNLTAPMVLTNAFLAAAGSAGTARREVVFISSAAAHQVVGGWSAYCATKAGAEMFFRVLAEQYAGDPRVHVASVNPGQMATGMQEEIRAVRGAYFPRQQDWRDSHEQGRLRAPAEVARKIIAAHLTDG